MDGWNTLAARWYPPLVSGRAQLKIAIRRPIYGVHHKNLATWENQPQRLTSSKSLGDVGFLLFLGSFQVIMANSDLASRNFRILTLKDEHSRSSTSSTKKSTEELPEFPLDRKKRQRLCVEIYIYIYFFLWRFWTGGEVDVGVFFGVLVGLVVFWLVVFFFGSWKQFTPLHWKNYEVEKLILNMNKNVCLLEATRTLRVPNWTGIWYGESALGSIWQCLEGPGEQWKKGPNSCLGYIGDEILPNYMGNIILNHYTGPKP